MKNLVEYLIKSIVQKPDEVSINQQTGEGFTTVEIKADPNDLGQIIGKKGKIIKALQALVQIRGIKENQRLFLKVAPTRESEKEGVVSSAT